MGYANILFELTGKHNLVHVSHVKSLNALATFARHLAKYSSAGIPRIAFTESKLVDLPGNPAIVPADVGVYANMLFRNTSTGELAGVLLPAPDMDIFEQIQDRGYRVKADIGAKFATYYSSLSGDTYIFHDGWLGGGSA